MTKRLLLIAAFALIAFSLLYSDAFAVYTWVDDQGVFHIADYPKPGKREEPKENISAPEVASPAAPEKKQSPTQPAPLAPMPLQPRVAPAAATVPSSAGTLTTSPLVPAAKGAAAPAGTPTMRPATPVSSPTLTRSGHDAVATGATVSQPTATAPLPAMQQPSPTALPVPQKPPQMPVAGIMAFVMAFFMVILALVVGLYIYFSLCLFLIARKLNVQAPWTAWIPIVQTWTFISAAGKPFWWILLFLIPLVNIIVGVYLWMCITENLGRNKWQGLLILVPIVSLVYIGVLAFSKQEQQAGFIGEEWTPS